MTSITIGGSDQSVSTSSVVRTETGKGKRTAVLAGGGAALGALIGGLAGGGKGAGIGALAIQVIGDSEGLPTRAELDALEQAGGHGTQASGAAAANVAL